MEQIRVSYLITTKNRAEFLRRTLENVREFMTPRDEIVLIDGASSDATAAVAAEHHDIIATFVSEPDIGEAHAFNKGLFRARGTYLKPITDDDYFHPEAMHRLITAMESHPEVDAILCGGEVWRVEKDGSVVFETHRSLPTHIAPTPMAIFDYVNIGLGLMVRRSALEKTGGVSAGYRSVDGDLACRLLECGCLLRYFDINLYRWYIRPHSTFNDSPAMRRDAALFDVRLGRLDQVDFAPLARLVRRPESLVKGLWLAQRLANSPGWPFIILLYGLAQGVGTAKAVLGRACWSTHAERAPATFQWTDKLL